MTTDSVDKAVTEECRTVDCLAARIMDTEESAVRRIFAVHDLYRHNKIPQELLEYLRKLGNANIVQLTIFYGADTGLRNAARNAYAHFKPPRTTGEAETFLKQPSL